MEAKNKVINAINTEINMHPRYNTTITKPKHHT